MELLGAFVLGFIITSTVYIKIWDQTMEDNSQLKKALMEHEHANCGFISKFELDYRTFKGTSWLSTKKEVE